MEKFKLDKELEKISHLESYPFIKKNYDRMLNMEMDLGETLELINTILALAKGARDRIEPESNYYAVYYEGKTKRYTIDDNLPIKELVYPEFFDIKLTSFCRGKCHWCVSPDTLINTPNGIIPIQDIVKGDIVMGDNGDICEQTVDQLFERNYEGDMIELVLNDGKTLSLTPDHEIFTLNRGWVLAKDLTIEDDIKIIGD